MKIMDMGLGSLAVIGDTPYMVDESSLIFFLDNVDRVYILGETKGKKWKT